MAKRFLALTLIVAMLASGLTFGATAATTERFEGLNYVPVTNEEELATALSSGGNILLKNDIELSTKFKAIVSIKPGTVINGNGHTLTYTTKRTAAMFRIAAGSTITVDAVEFRNVNFGTKDSPIEISGLNGMFVNATANSAIVNFNNVNFYVVRTGITNSAANTGALFANIGIVANFNGCNLDVTMTGVTGGSLHGGWFGEVSSQVTMKNCTTRGIIESPNTAGGFAGQNSTGNLQLIDCTNFATVTAPNRAAGLVGNVGSSAHSLYFTNCTNYGKITATGTGYYTAAGGVIGMMSNQKDPLSSRLRVIYGCKNYGEVTSGNAAGGILGRVHEYDYVNNTQADIQDCANYGKVNGVQFAGGILGSSAPNTHKVAVDNCVNLGKISSSAGYAGNIAGMLSARKTENATVSNSYAAGIVSAADGKAGAVVGLTSGKYTIQAGEETDKAYDVVVPTLTNVKSYGSLSDVMDGLTVVDATGLDALLAEMSENLGIRLVAADEDNEDALIVFGDPVIRGAQLKVTASGATSIRFAAAINSKEAYSAFGFDYTMTTADGTTVTDRITTYRLYESINENVDGSVNAISTESAYLFMGILKNIPTDQRVIIQITPFALDKDGETEYNGSTKLIAVENGTIDDTEVMLNGYTLRDYVIVYASTDKMAEKQLAQRLSSKIKMLTGVAIPVMSQAAEHTYAAEIVVGKTNRATEYPDGRAIYSIADGTKIIMKGDTTAELGESHQYFLELFEEKLLSGESAWDVTDITVPVDTEISLMAYNMGAKDDSRIHLYEWNLIWDYMPDIWTSQEPWAGFLDSFLNNYAVKPSPSFESSSNDDVMKSDVNNKAFEGNGYYGVYWGLPRWVPGDPCTAGKASYSVIVYAKDRFEVDLEKSGTFWLSEKPDVSGTNISGSNFARCATYATLTDKNTGEQLVVVNVHLDFLATVQTKQISVLLTELSKRVDTDLPIFITGDMNSYGGSDPIKFYKSNSIMPMTALDEIADQTYRYHSNIDWFFTNHADKIEVSLYKFCGEKTFLNNLWNSSLVVGMPSDHPAIYTEFTIKPTSGGGSEES